MIDESDRELNRVLTPADEEKSNPRKISVLFSNPELERAPHLRKN
jgi:hypothetical protein